MLTQTIVLLYSLGCRLGWWWMFFASNSH